MTDLWSHHPLLHSLALECLAFAGLEIFDSSSQVMAGAVWMLCVLWSLSDLSLLRH